METITGANGVRPLEGALICKSRDDLVRYRTSLAQPPALRQILRARRGRLQPGLMRRSGATQADTSATILEPALVGATRLFHHEGRRHPVSRRQAALSLPGQIGDRFYKPARPVLAGRQVRRPGTLTAPGRWPGGAVNSSG